MSSAAKAVWLILLLSTAVSAFCQPPAPAVLWRDADAVPARVAEEVWIQPRVFRAVHLNENALQTVLARAPKEFAVPGQQAPEITLPMPDGTTARFHIAESPVMAPGLAARFPEIKTYSGRGIDDPAASLRFDWTPAGFHAQILSPKGTVYIDPHLKGNRTIHASYFKRDQARAEGFQCLVPDVEREVELAAHGTLRSGPTLRKYRFACAATGEYTQFHGGTVASALAAIVTTVNRINGIFEAEVAIRLELVEDNDQIIFTDAGTDPYSGGVFTMLGQNQSTLDSVIGNSNYDIGHLLTRGSNAAIADLGVVCLAGSKARGVTGTSNPTGDPFWVDFVAHEIGHQFNARHTFNSTMGFCGASTQRHASTAYEPGSGSTIMAYAGICNEDNLQPHSDPYFHSASFDEVISFINGFANGCAVQTFTGNSAPEVSAGPNFTIPHGTPFTLTASGSDPDDDALTYCWEQRDLGPATSLTSPDNGSSPLFRSFPPTSSPSRTFPRLASLLNNVASPGEMLPTQGRTMRFRVTARDNRPGGGGVGTADMEVTVADTGPFRVIAPNTPVIWSGAQTVQWNVAGTDGWPISASSVNVLLSTNGGVTFPVVLAAGVPNSGAAAVMLPDVTSSSARVRVEAIGNIFFDVSDVNFTLAPISEGPMIFGVAAEATLTGAAIMWNTLSNAAAQVQYGLTTNLGTFSAILDTAGTKHLVWLSDLLQDADYFYRVIAHAGGEVFVSPIHSFRTEVSVILDNPQAAYSGSWVFANSAPDKYGSYYLHTAGVTGPPTSYATYAPNLPQGGIYDVYLWFPAGANRTTSAPILIAHAGGEMTTFVDQTQNGGTWHLVAPAMEFAAGPSGFLRIYNNSGESDRIVMADAVRFSLVQPFPAPLNGTVPGWWASFYFGNSNIDASLDHDGDGYSTFEEYVIGTAPTGSGSRFRLWLEREGAASFQALFSPVQSGRTYELQATSTMPADWWQTVASVPASAVLSGQGSVLLHNAPGRKFYRMLIELDP